MQNLFRDLDTNQDNILEEEEIAVFFEDKGGMPPNLMTDEDKVWSCAVVIIAVVVAYTASIAHAA